MAASMRLGSVMLSRGFSRAFAYSGRQSVQFIQRERKLQNFSINAGSFRKVSLSLRVRTGLCFGVHSRNVTSAWFDKVQFDSNDRFLWK